ncbi:MAG TPA: hypothetical protein VLD57_11175 [Blastocatellia bacterium]|nr:hypothetical protein [Blastocatellia bacterium]
MVERVRRTISASIGVLLIVTGLLPALSATAYGQRRAPAKPAAKKPAAPLSVYGQGYQKGYSDGFAQGGRDWNQKARFDIFESDAYRQRESLYDARHASSQEYREGYHLGFELGYPDGYYGRARNASVPANAELLYRATVLASSQPARQPERQPEPQPEPQPVAQNEPPPQYDPAPRPPVEQTRPRTSAPVSVAADTEMRIRLTSPIDTKNNRPGDKFTAEVLMPGAYEGSIIEGHIARLEKSGKVTGRTELSLAFDTITLRDGRQGPISAQLERVIESETVKEVDAEGNVRSGSRSKDSQVRGGVGAAAGAIIGGIVGGGKGAILGAVIGGAAGVGTVFIEGDKTLVLDPGTEMVIRTDRPSR